MSKPEQRGIRYLRTATFTFVQNPDHTLGGVADWGHVIAPDPVGKYFNLNFGSNRNKMWGVPPGMSRLTLQEWSGLAKQAEDEFNAIGGHDFFYSLPISHNVRHLARGETELWVSST